jgi:hypothetical protein
MIYRIEVVSQEDEAAEILADAAYHPRRRWLLSSR